MVTWDQVIDWYNLDGGDDDEWIANVQSRILHHIASIGSQQRQTELPIAREVFDQPTTSLDDLKYCLRFFMEKRVWALPFHVNWDRIM